MSTGNDHNIQPPGERIRQLLIEKGWTQDDLAQISDRPRPTIVNIINGKTAITPETALALAKAFGVEPSYWMNLEANYRLFQALPVDEDGITRRVRIFEMAPIKEMERRGWIRHTENINELERELSRFFGV